MEPQDPKQLQGEEKRRNSAILGTNSISSERHETRDGQFVLQSVCCWVFWGLFVFPGADVGNAHSLRMHTCSC